MVMVISGTCKPTVGVMARLMRVVRYCIDKPTFSWRFKLAKHSLKLRFRVEADRVSHESTSKSLSSGEAEIYVLNLGCAAGSLVVN